MGRCFRNYRLKENMKSIEEAKDLYLQGLLLALNTMKTGDYKTNNKIINKQVRPAFQYIVNRNKTECLLNLLEHDNLDLRIAVARELLPYQEEKAIYALSSIASSKVSGKSGIAEIVLKEWKNIPM